MTAASQSCHKEDKFFEVHLGISIFIQVLEDFINGILVLPRLQRKKEQVEVRGCTNPMQPVLQTRSLVGLWALGKVPCAPTVCPAAVSAQSMCFWVYYTCELQSGTVTERHLCYI